MIANSLEKASWWGSFRAFATGLPSFLFGEDALWECSWVLLFPQLPALELAHLGPRNGTGILCLLVLLSSLALLGWELWVLVLHLL